MCNEKASTHIQTFAKSTKDTRVERATSSSSYSAASTGGGTGGGTGSASSALPWLPVSSCEFSIAKYAASFLSYARSVVCGVRIVWALGGFLEQVWANQLRTMRGIAHHTHQNQIKTKKHETINIWTRCGIWCVTFLSLWILFCCPLRYDPLRIPTTTTMNETNRYVTLRIAAYYYYYERNDTLRYAPLQYATIRYDTLPLYIYYIHIDASIICAYR